MAFIKSALRDEETDLEISEWKTIKLIKKFCRILKAAIQGEPHLTREVKQLIQEVAKTCRKEKKRKTVNTNSPPMKK